MFYNDTFQICDSDKTNIESFSNTGQNFQTASNSSKVKDVIPETNRFNLLQGVTPKMSDNSQYAILAIKVVPLCKIINTYELFQIEKLQVIKINHNGHDRTSKIQRQFEEFMGFNNLQYSKLQDMSTSFVCNIEKKDPNNAYQRERSRFVFNKNYIQHHAYSRPVVHGQVQCALSRVRDRIINSYIISRKDCRRLGSRLWCRGCDEAGNCANQVETEHIMEILELQEGFRVQTFLITRGSPSIIWGQSVNLDQNPPLRLDINDAKTNEPGVLHLDEQLSFQKSGLIVNLIEQTKHQQNPVGKQFNKLVEDYLKDHKDQLSNIWFDFHKECSSKRGGWAQLKKLLSQAKSFLDTHKSNLILVNKNEQVITQRQTGIARINCFDSLDRTNVVQTIFCKYMVYKFLSENIKGFIDKQSGSNLEKIHELPNELEFNFRNQWTDNADALSNSYTGTGSLKTDQTRTGKRNWWGPLKDGYNSQLRYFMNNLQGSTRDNVYNEIYDGHFKSMKFQKHSALFFSLIVPICMLSIIGVVMYYHFQHHQTFTYEIMRVLDFASHPVESLLLVENAAVAKSISIFKKLNKSSIQMKKYISNQLGLSESQFVYFRWFELIVIIGLVMMVFIKFLNKFKNIFVGKRDKDTVINK